jgi:hypothetical protein
MTIYSRIPYTNRFISALIAFRVLYQLYTHVKPGSIAIFFSRIFMYKIPEFYQYKRMSCFWVLFLNVQKSIIISLLSTRSNPLLQQATT